MPSIVTVRRAIEKLRTVVSEYEYGRPKDPEDRDVTLCRAIRSASLELVYVYGWNPLHESVDIPGCAKLLKQLIIKSQKLMEANNYSEARQYRESVANKLEWVQTIIAGGKITHIMARQKDRPKTFEERLKYPGRDGQLPSFSNN